MNSPCCEKCLDYDTDSGKMCFNPACPCHSNSQEKGNTHSHTVSGEGTILSIPRGMSFDGHEGPATIINYQPSEAWEEEFDAAFVQEGVSGNYIQLTMNSAPEVKSFIRTLIAEAREEGRIGGHRRYNEGYQHGAEDGRMEVHSKDGAAWDAGLAQGRGAKENITTMRLKAFDEGRKEALKECLEVVEGMKKEMDFVLPHDSVTVIGILSHNEAVEAIKQQITSLLEKHE